MAASCQIFWSLAGSHLLVKANLARRSSDLVQIIAMQAISIKNMHGNR
jgi:hypothetical protein